FPAVVVALLSNVAQGAIDFAHTVRIQPNYPFAYIYSSMFSVLPGSLDDYDRIRDLYQIRINKPNPISTFGEVYYFGWLYLVGLMAVTLWFLRAATLQMFERVSIFTIPIVIFTLLLIYRLHHYPTRISQRIMLLLLLFYALEYGIGMLNRSRQQKRKLA